MGFFDAFTPEGLIRAMGIDPREMVAFISSLQSEMAAMKSGFRGTVLHFDARLKAIEATQARIEARIEAALAAAATPPSRGNGAAPSRAARPRLVEGSLSYE